MQVVIEGIAKSSFVDILEFKNYDEYQYLKEFFENTFLNNQLRNLEKAS